MKNRFCFALLSLLALSCGKTPEPGPQPVPDEEFRIPDPPQTVVESNMFVVEWFPDLPSEAEASGHILASNDKKPLVYIFDRVQYVPGQSTPLVSTAVGSKCYPFFIQAGATSFSGNGGTGFLTRYSISDFDGECAETPFGGPVITTALSSVVSIAIYGCNCSTPQQLTSVVGARSQAFYGDAVMVGAYGGDPEQMKEIAGSKVLAMRFDYVAVSDKIIYSIVQPGYVNRGFEKKALGDIEYVRILFEKLY